MANPGRGQCLLQSATTAGCWAFVLLGKRIMELESGTPVLRGDSG